MKSAKSPIWIILPFIEGALWAALGLAYIQQTWNMPAVLDKTLAYLGAISFSLNAWHSPIVTAFVKYPAVLTLNVWYLDFLLIVMPTIVAVSALSYSFIEKPFFAFRSRYVRRPKAAPIHS